MTQNAHFWSPCICSSMYIVSTNQLKLTSFLMTATIVMFKARTGARYELLSMIDLANLQTNQKVPKIMMSKPFVFMKTTLPGNWKQNVFHTIVYTKSLFASDQVSKDTQLYAPAVGRQHYWLSYIGTNNIESKESVKKEREK